MVKSVSEIIDLWPKPKVANFARDLGITTEHGAAMKRRDSIPVAYWPKVISACKARKIKGVSLGVLVSIHAGGAQ